LKLVLETGAGLLLPKKSNLDARWMADKGQNSQHAVTAESNTCLNPEQMVLELGGRGKCWLFTPRDKKK
jgi:hypothetical protein